MEFYQDQVQAWLRANHPDKSLADIGYDGPIIRKHFTSMPDLPYAIPTAGENGSATDIPADRTHRLRLRIYVNNAATEFATLPVAAIASEPFTITYNSESKMVMQIKDVWGPFTTVDPVDAGDDVKIFRGADIDPGNPGDDPTDVNRYHFYERKGLQNLTLVVDAGQVTNRLIGDLQERRQRGDPQASQGSAGPG